MRIVSSLVLLLVVVTCSSRAAAEDTVAIVVDRAPGSERCPDAEALGARVAQIRGRAAGDAAIGYRVAFARKDDGFLATIRSATGAGSVRTLEHDGAHCGALGHAVALTLALLFDADVEAKVVEPPPPAAPAATAAPAAPRLPSSPPRARKWSLSIGAAGLVGILRPVSPALFADTEVDFANVRLGAGGLFAFPQNLPLGPGAVRERLVGGFARGCLTTWRREFLQLDVCSGLSAGAVTAEAEGYTQNHRRTRIWIAVPVEAAFGHRASPIGWEVSIAGLVPLRRSDFTVDGVGEAYASPPLGAMLSVRVLGIVPW
jgi:hypothetical protein